MAWFLLREVRAKGKDSPLATDVFPVAGGGHLLHGAAVASSRDLRAAIDRKAEGLGGRFDHDTASDAPGAGSHFFDLAAGKLGPNPLQIGMKPAFGFIVGVTDIVADTGAFAAKITFFCHSR